MIFININENEISFEKYKLFSDEFLMKNRLEIKGLELLKYQ